MHRYENSHNETTEETQSDKTKNIHIEISTVAEAYLFFSMCHFLLCCASMNISFWGENLNLKHYLQLKATGDHFQAKKAKNIQTKSRPRHFQHLINECEEFQIAFFALFHSSLNLPIYL